MIKRIENLLGRKAVPYLIIAIIVLIIYSNSFTSPFLLDDFSSISNNYAIRNPLDVHQIWQFYSNRFVLYFTLSINYIIHNNDVIGYHIVNVALHMFNGILVFLILFNLLGLKHFRRKPPGKYRNTISLLAALIFVCHPVQVNAVTYIIQRTAALAAMFYFLAILCFIKYRVNDKIKYFLLTLLFTILAMFTKENTITIPFMLLILEFLFFMKDGKTTWKKRLAFMAVLFLTIPIIPSTTLWLGHNMSDPDRQFKASTSMDRFYYFYTELNVIVLYIKQVFVPDKLNFDYSNDFPISHTIWQNHSYVSFIILSVIMLLGLLAAKRNKLMSLGILWFFTGLAVESSFLSIKDVYFEHRLYFPMAGFVIFLIGLSFTRVKLLRRYYLFRKPVLYFIIVSCVAIVSYSAVTLYRNYIFSDEIRLWTDVTKKAPNSDRAHCVLGTDYLDKYEYDQDKFSVTPRFLVALYAEIVLHKSIVFDNDYIAWPDIVKKNPYTNRSLSILETDYLSTYKCAREKNELNLNISETELKKAIDLNNSNSTAHCNLAKVYFLQGKYQSCIDECHITNNFSKSEYADFNMGNAYKKLGKIDDAIKAYLAGYELDNRCTFILKALGNTYYENEDNKNAVFYFEEFLKNNNYADSAEIKKKLEEIKKTGSN